MGGLTHTCSSVRLGSGRPHHITTKTSLYGLACLVGAVKPSHPILPPVLSSLPPSTSFSVSFAISIPPISGFLSHQKLNLLALKLTSKWQRSPIIQFPITVCGAAFHLPPLYPNPNPNSLFISHDGAVVMEKCGKELQAVDYWMRPN